MMRAIVHRFPAAAPDDTSALIEAAAAGILDPSQVVAVLGKTEGNGCVNDFTRGFATMVMKHALAHLSGRSEAAVSASVVFVMSGGTEGGLSPHWLVFEARPDPSPQPGAGKRLAIGTAITRRFAPEEIGRPAQAETTAAAVRQAMAQAGIASADDVHYVQVKCPLLTKARITEAAARGCSVAAHDTYESMACSRGASALGVALALGEADAIAEATICHDWLRWSGRASTSAGVELMDNHIMVLGNSAAWTSDFVIGHGVMQDALDVSAVATALRSVGIEPAMQLTAAEQSRVAAVLAKADPSRSGMIRGRRHIMLDDSDINATRHARALVGGVLAGIFGDTALFVSGGAEHQGPDGGGAIAVIARVQQT
jgi:cyanuric acid amidohydrolase